MQFPAMRRLSLATANAFLICYATTSAPSFGSVKQCFEEIREQRADFQVKYVTDANLRNEINRKHLAEHPNRTMPSTISCIHL